MTTLKRLLSRPEVAELLGVSEAALSRWAVRGYGPPVIALGRRRAYDSDDVADWIERQKTRNTAQAAERGDTTGGSA